VRILFTFVGGTGHLNPLVPIARGAQNAGHVVAFAGRSSMVPTVEAAGFVAYAIGAAPEAAPARLELRAPDAAREDRDLRDGFADRLARERATAILALVSAWRPNLIVCDEVDFGAIVAAERLGLPYATVLVIAAGSFVRHVVVAEPLHALRAEHGLPPDPDLTMLSRYLVLSPFPPRYRDPRSPLPATAHALRPQALEPIGSDPVPAWITRLNGAPTVYFTLGTVFNIESGDLMARIIAALRDLPINLVVTVGFEIDPAEFGPQPATVHIEQYLSQSTLLPHCRMVISHGGSGTVIGALAHGLPMVLIPLGADQLVNAARCAELGVARLLDAMEVTPERVQTAVSAMLADPSYRRHAERIRDEVAELPGPAHAVTLLERLVAEKRPLVSV